MASLSFSDTLEGCVRLCMTPEGRDRLLKKKELEDGS